MIKIFKEQNMNAKSFKGYPIIAKTLNTPY